MCRFSNIFFKIRPRLWELTAFFAYRHSGIKRYILFILSNVHFFPLFGNWQLLRRECVILALHIPRPENSGTLFSGRDVPEQKLPAEFRRAESSEHVLCVFSPLFLAHSLAFSHSHPPPILYPWAFLIFSPGFERDISSDIITNASEKPVLRDLISDSGVAPPPYNFAHSICRFAARQCLHCLLILRIEFAHILLFFPLWWSGVSGSPFFLAIISFMPFNAERSPTYYNNSFSYGSSFRMNLNFYVWGMIELGYGRIFNKRLSPFLLSKFGTHTPLCFPLSDPSKALA